MPVSMTIDPAFLTKMQKAAARFRPAFEKAQKYAVAGAKRQFSSIMRAGGKPSKGVEKFRPDPLTKALKKAQGVRSYKADWYRKGANGEKELVKGAAMSDNQTKLFDGIQVRFATDDTYHVAFLSGGAWHVGFPKKVDAFLGPLLEPETKQFDEQTHWRLEHDSNMRVPNRYFRPRRLILEPWGKRLAEGEYLRWLLGALGKRVRQDAGLELEYQGVRE